MMAERLRPGGDRKGDLPYPAPPGAGDGIMERDRGVAVGTGIEDDAPLRRLLDPVDQDALVIALTAVDGEAEPLSRDAAIRFDLGQRHAAIDARLAPAEHVEIRPI